MASQVIIRNPPCFMNEQYLKKKALIGNYKEGTPCVILRDEYPVEIIITFPSEEIANEFIKEYKDSFVEPTFDM